MSILFLVLVPVALLALISGFCFVGCVLDTHGLGGGPDKPDDVPFTKYSDEDVLPTCVAYWPLSEPSPADDSGKIACHDAKGTNDGEYKHKGNAPTLFPCPLMTGPDIYSANESGFLELGATNIVPGDATQPGNDPKILNTGMTVGGAFVTVPFNAVINPPVFTVEAWARPEWDATAPAAFRAVVDSRDSVGPAAFGFAIWVNKDGLWEAQLCLSGGTPFLYVPAIPAVLGEIAHVVLTFDGLKAGLFINGNLESSLTQLPAQTTFAPNAARPLVIGVGLPWLPDRTQPSDQVFFPLLPFNGTIQDVAIYDTVLSDDDIMKHFNDGSGKTTVPAG